MNIVEGQKCRFLEPLGMMNEKGEVLSVNDNGTFTVYEPMNCPAQYNDTFIDFREEDIGKKVWFD